MSLIPYLSTPMSDINEIAIDGRKESQTFPKQFPELHHLLINALEESTTLIAEQNNKKKELKESRGSSLYKASDYIGYGLGIGLWISGLCLGIIGAQNNLGKKVVATGATALAATVPTILIVRATIRVAIKKITGNDFTNGFLEINKNLYMLKENQRQIQVLYEKGRSVAKFCKALDQFELERNSTTRSKVAQRYKELLDATQSDELPRKAIERLFESDLPFYQVMKETARNAFQEEVEMLLREKSDSEDSNSTLQFF